jgi:DNA ligase 1
VLLIFARLKSIEILSNFLRSVIALTPEDLLHCIYLCLNRIAPAYEGIELGIGESLLMKAIAQATGKLFSQVCQFSHLCVNVTGQRKVA